MTDPEGHLGIVSGRRGSLTMYDPPQTGLNAPYSAQSFAHLEPPFLLGKVCTETFGRDQQRSNIEKSTISWSAAAKQTSGFRTDQL